MILFINVIITEDRKRIYFRGLYPEENSFTEFKYCLASLTVIPWDRVIIYCELAEEHKHRADELDTYIHTLFQNVELFFHRNGYVHQWRAAMENIFITPNIPVWFMCNHDHIYLDYELGLLNRLVNVLNNSAPLTTCYLSHYPEMHLRVGHAVPISHICDDYLTIQVPLCDSIQLVRQEVLRHWWFEFDYPADVFFPRTDGTNIGNYNVAVKSHDLTVMIPFRELCRHFDAYNHHNYQDSNKCPPLFIPDGFWNGEMQIAYCDTVRRPGKVCVNPLSKTYYAVSPDGVDLRCVLEDLPLFWKSRIKSIEIVQDIPEAELIKARNEAYYDLLFADTHGMAAGLSPLPSENFEIAFR